MGNTSSSSSKRKGSSKQSNNNDAAAAFNDSVRDLQTSIQSGIRKLEEQDHPAAQLLDTVCGPYLDPHHNRSHKKVHSFYSEDEEDEDDSRTVSEDETTQTDYPRRRPRSKADHVSVDTGSYLSTDYDEGTVETEDVTKHKSVSSEYETDSHDGLVQSAGGAGQGLSQPLASSFAKRCYFTKQGIGKTTQHYEGLTLTGNIVLMLASAMKLKGCPTICDEDLRRVEQTYPNQFSRLPDELLLSSGWRRISKYCHFSSKPIPDGVPFFHSKQRLHSSGGYYFLLAAAVGMVRPIDVEPLTRDTLVLLETDYPAACDAAPECLVKDPDQWTLVQKFCFFSGGPINTEEDVYYQADFDGNPIYMLAFLSPSLTPNELYKLDGTEPGLASVAAVEEVESVYDLTERDFDDLRLYHLGPCRALPQYILQPQAWTKVLPPHFLGARQQAMMLAQEYEAHGGMGGRPPQQQQQHLYGGPPPPGNAPEYYQENQQQPFDQSYEQQPYDQQPYDQSYEQQPFDQSYDQQPFDQSYEQQPFDQSYEQQPYDQQEPSYGSNEFQRQVEEEGAFMDANVPIDEAIAAHAATMNRPAPPGNKLDPPEDEPPSLSKRQQTPDQAYQYQKDTSYNIADADPNNSYESAEYYNAQENATTRNEHYNYDTAPMEGQYYQGSDLSGDQLRSSPEPSFDVSQDISLDHMAPSSPTARQRTNNDRPPKSPRSPLSPGGSEYSQSSAMRGAHEMLKRNRQRRLEMARQLREQKQAQQHGQQHQTQEQEHQEVESAGPDDEEMENNPNIPESQSGVTLDSSSEMTSVVSGSSVWTDNSNNPDRSSRRALILQMAKARMKTHNKRADGSAIPEEQNDDSYDMEEKKTDLASDSATDIDIAGDLD